MDLNSLTINKVHQGLLDKKFSALELAKSYFDKILVKSKIY